MGTDLLPQFIREHYEVHEWKHACAILKHDFASEWNDVCEVLIAFRLRRSALIVGGGSKSDVSKSIDAALYARGWAEKQFRTAIVVDDTRTDSPTHKVDCFKNRVALEIEWNNKDPFFDRDLNNFRLLFELRTISAGIIVTRSDALQHIFNGLGRGSSFGASTTHMSKLLPRIHGGGGGGCPLLVVGITDKVYIEDDLQ
jgi:Restriction endonuclease BglII